MTSFMNYPKNINNKLTTNWFKNLPRISRESSPFEMDETNLQLEDHLQKCRCCFRMLIDDDKTVKITETIEQKFLGLTGVTVSKD